MSADQPVPEHPTRWQTVVKTAGVFWSDFRERAWSTFWQTFLSTLAISNPTTDWGTTKAIVVSAIFAGGAAVLSMAKALVVRNKGIKNSASASKNV